jgi:hypothetical protein
MDVLLFYANNMFIESNKSSVASPFSGQFSKWQGDIIRIRATFIISKRDTNGRKPHGSLPIEDFMDPDPLAFPPASGWITRAKSLGEAHRSSQRSSTIVTVVMRRVKVRTCPFCRRPLVKGSARRCNACRKIVCVRCFDVKTGLCPKCKATFAGRSKSDETPNYIL